MRRAAGAFAAALLLAAPALARGQDAEWMIAHTEVFGALTRPAVRFTHAEHQGLPGVTCLTCHHVFVNGRNVLDPSTLRAGDPSLRCAACHTTARDLHAAYHGLCVGCHDSGMKSWGVTGPRTCGECHPWVR